MKNKTIFILGATKYDEPFSSTSYSVAQHLAAENRVFYIDYPFTWNDVVRQRKTAGFKKRVRHFFSSGQCLKDTAISGLKIIISPPLLSINFLPEGKLYRYLLRYNQRCIARRVQQVIRKYGIEDFIYINSFNFHYPDIGDWIKPALQVYHCVDPVIMSYDIRHGIVSENRLLQRSQLVICTSRKLYEEKSKVNPNTVFIPNAADIEHSRRALNPELPVHPLIARLKKPVIGYVGTIERRIDYALLKAVITQNPDMQFAFVGPISPEFVPDWLYHTPNLALVGTVPYQDTPAVIKGFDVALIPFKKDEISCTIFPLKLFEYLGAGKPVVSTDFNPDLEEYTHGTVAFCQTAESFSAALQAGLTAGHPAYEQRIAVAEENTWQQRVATLGSLLEENLVKARAKARS